MAVTTREGLKQYALRALGAPVLQINVADEQLEDRLDEAISYFQLYHYDGIERMYLKHKVTPSELKITGTNGADFVAGTDIIGLSSGAKATVQKGSDGNTIRIRGIGAYDFVAGEIVRGGGGSNPIATLEATDFFVEGDTERKYVEIPDIIYGVIRVIPFRQGSSSANLFDVQYQLRLNDLYELTNTSMLYYSMVMQHMTMLDQMLNGYPQFEFNRLGGKLYMPINWNKLATDDYFIIECYRALDPETNRKMYGEPWLKLYVEALFKKQWATNLKKFQNMQLPGGVVLDGQAMYLEADNEIQRLEDELQNKSAPLGFIMG